MRFYLEAYCQHSNALQGVTVGVFLRISARKDLAALLCRYSIGALLILLILNHNTAFLSFDFAMLANLITQEEGWAFVWNGKLQVLSLPGWI